MNTTVLRGICAPLFLDNVDTDVIIPSNHIRSVSKNGHADGLFAPLRYCRDGSQNSNFVLNCAPFDSAIFLAVGKNFGCGSSREFAVWALKEFGIRAIFATSFGEIFALNCLENGVLPVRILPNDKEFLAAFFKSDSSCGEMVLDVDQMHLTFGPNQISVYGDGLKSTLSNREHELCVSSAYLTWKAQDTKKREWLYRT